MSQRRVAEDAGVSRQWLSELEAGKPTAEVGLVLRVLDVLNVVLLPEVADTEATSDVDLDHVLEEYRRR